MKTKLTQMNSKNYTLYTGIVKPQHNMRSNESVLDNITNAIKTQTSLH